MSWWRGLVPVRFAPDGEARSRPGVTVAGGPPVQSERYWSQLSHRLGQRGRTPRLPYQRDRLLAPPQQGEGAPHPGSNSGSGVEAPAENFFNLGGWAAHWVGWCGGSGVAAAWWRRGFWSRQCSPWSSAVAVLGQGGDVPVVVTTGA